MASGIYDSAFTKIIAAGLLATGTFKAELNTSGYTFSKAHQYRSDVNASEVTGTGYTAGGVAEAVTVTLDTVNHRYIVNLPDAVWAAATISGEDLIIYVSLGGAATADPLLCCIDAGSMASSTNGTFTFHMTSGLMIQN